DTTRPEVTFRNSLGLSFFVNLPSLKADTILKSFSSKFQNLENSLVKNSVKFPSSASSSNFSKILSRTETDTPEAISSNCNCSASPSPSFACGKATSSSSTSEGKVGTDDLRVCEAEVRVVKVSRIEPIHPFQAITSETMKQMACYIPCISGRAQKTGKKLRLILLKVSQGLITPTRFLPFYFKMSLFSSSAIYIEIKAISAGRKAGRPVASEARADNGRPKELQVIKPKKKKRRGECMPIPRMRWEMQMLAHSAMQRELGHEERKNESANSFKLLFREGWGTKKRKRKPSVGCMESTGGNDTLTAPSPPQLLQLSCFSKLMGIAIQMLCEANQRLALYPGEPAKRTTCSGPHIIQSQPLVCFLFTMATEGERTAIPQGPPLSTWTLRSSSEALLHVPPPQEVRRVMEVLTHLLLTHFESVFKENTQVKTMRVELWSKPHLGLPVGSLAVRIPATGRKKHFSHAGHITWKASPLTERDSASSFDLEINCYLKCLPPILLSGIFKISGTFTQCPEDITFIILGVDNSELDVRKQFNSI
ncbi:Uncharacterized protein PODLI_1B032299, partial [Podarcis lilfordi]